MTRKVLVSFDSRLLERLDRAARDRGLSRSALLSDLVARTLGVRTPVEEQAIAQAHRDLVQLFERHGTDPDVATAIREERDQRRDRLAP